MSLLMLDGRGLRSKYRRMLQLSVGRCTPDQQHLRRHMREGEISPRGLVTPNHTREWEISPSRSSHPKSHPRPNLSQSPPTRRPRYDVNPLENSLALLCLVADPVYGLAMQAAVGKERVRLPCDLRAQLATEAARRNPQRDGQSEITRLRLGIEIDREEWQHAPKPTESLNETPYPDWSHRVLRQKGW